MSRYINADKLIEHITNTADLGGWIGEALQQIKQVAIKYINLTPSIDIVRCKECENFIPMTHGCKRSPSVEPWWEDDFCSYGSRSEKPNNSTRSILEQVGKE